MRSSHVENSSIDTGRSFLVLFRPFRPETMYAVLETGSKQYRVVAGETLDIERLEVEAGQPYTFDRVLMVNNDGEDIGGLSHRRQCDRGG